jgi:phosphatidylglycerophosphate synthase
MKLFTLPNLLSLLRLPLATAFLLIDSTIGRVAIVSTVALTDFADGFLARRMPSHDRRAGALIDPITDKLFVLIALLMFTARRDLSVTDLLIVLMRDIYKSAACLLLKLRRWQISFRARFSGKLVTVLQLSVLLALLFWQAGVRPLIWLVALASIVAIIDYTLAGIQQRRLATAGQRS